MNVKLYSCGIDRTGEDVLTPDAHASYLSKFSADEFEIPHLSTSDSFTITLPRCSDTTPPVDRFYNYMDADGEFFFLSRSANTPVVGDVVTYDARKDKPHSYRVADPAKVFTPRSVIRRTSRPIFSQEVDQSLDAGRSYLRSVKSILPYEVGATPKFDVLVFWDIVGTITDGYVARPVYGGPVSEYYAGISTSVSAPFSYQTAIAVASDLARIIDRMDAYSPSDPDAHFSWTPTHIFIIESRYVPASWRENDPGFRVEDDSLPLVLRSSGYSTVVKVWGLSVDRDTEGCIHFPDGGNDVDVGNVNTRIRLKNSTHGHSFSHTLSTRLGHMGGPLSFIINLDGSSYDFTSYLSYAFEHAYVVRQAASADVASTMLSAVSAAISATRVAAGIASGSVPSIISGAGTLATSVVGLLNKNESEQVRTITNSGFSLVPAREVYSPVWASSSTPIVTYATVFIYHYESTNEAAYNNMKRGYYCTIYPAATSASASLRPYLWVDSQDHRLANHTYVQGDITFVDDDHPDDTLEIYRRGIDIYTDADVYGKVIERD